MGRRRRVAWLPAGQHSEAFGSPATAGSHCLLKSQCTRDRQTTAGHHRGARPGPGAHLCWTWLSSHGLPLCLLYLATKLKNLLILKMLFGFPLRSGAAAAVGQSVCGLQAAFSSRGSCGFFFFCRRLHTPPLSTLPTFPASSSPGACFSGKGSR